MLLKEILLILNENHMKNLLLLILASVVSITAYTQAISIVCPADLTVSIYVLDKDYESYGDPIVNTQASYSLDKEITQYTNTCVERYTELRYTATTSNSSAWCIQRIDVPYLTLDDVNMPEDIELDGITVEEATPELAGHPEPYEYLSENLLTTYNDHVILPVPGGTGIAKIIRSWTVLSWCTGNILQDDQLIKITNYIPGTGSSLFDIPTCNGGSIGIIDLTVTTDDPNISIDFSSCTIGSDLTSYMNCIAANNPIADGYSYKLELTGPDDYLNGVSTLDIVLILKHILAVNVFGNDCQKMAADVNSDGNISAFDLVLLRRLILGIDSQFSDSSSWKFAGTEYIDVNGNSGTGLSFTSGAFPLQSLSVEAVKTGDVNNSADTGN